MTYHRIRDLLGEQVRIYNFLGVLHLSAELVKILAEHANDRLLGMLGLPHETVKPLQVARSGANDRAWTAATAHTSSLDPSRLHVAELGPASITANFGSALRSHASVVGRHRLLRGQGSLVARALGLQIYLLVGGLADLASGWSAGR